LVLFDKGIYFKLINNACVHYFVLVQLETVSLKVRKGFE